MKKTLLVFIVGLSLFSSLVLTSCGIKKSSDLPATVSVSVDSLNSAFVTAWNKKDTAAVGNMFADDAIMLSSDWRLSTKDSLCKIWIKENIFKDIHWTTVTAKTAVSCDLACLSGTYILTFKKDENTEGRQVGSYTFIWKNLPEKGWKLIMMEIDGK